MPMGIMRGVFPILSTPFDEAGRVDEESLRSLVEFNLRAGVHGLGVALASEIYKLSEAERLQEIRIVVDQVGGRVPVVVNTGAQGTDLAVMHSRIAEENGANALMVMPPSFLPPTAAEVRQYFKAISDAVSIPIFMQDIPMAPISADLARQIVAESERACYIKVEGAFTALRVAEVVAGAGDRLVVFGGAAGVYFVEEMRRGSVGTMPGCCQPEAFVEVWNLFQGGNPTAAEAVFMQNIVPVNRLCDQSPGAIFHVTKEILRQRGVIRTARVRGPAQALDEVTSRELQHVIDKLYHTTQGAHQVDRLARPS